MSLLSFIPVIGTILDKLIPDKNAREKAQQALETMEQNGELQLLLGQIRTNTQEAKHSNLFVAGWRPFIGWSCGIIFVYHGIIVHLIEYISALHGVDVTSLPKFDLGIFTSVLFGMLGLGSMRSFEKYKGVDTKGVNSK